jgi:hypothetical protein
MPVGAEDGISYVREIVGSGKCQVLGLIPDGPKLVMTVLQSLLLLSSKRSPQA